MAYSEDFDFFASFRRNISVCVIFKRSSLQFTAGDWCITSLCLEQDFARIIFGLFLEEFQMNITKTTHELRVQDECKRVADE